MDWFKIFGWVIFAVFTASTLANIAIIGQKRKPITPGLATFSVFISALILIWMYCAIMGR